MGASNGARVTFACPTHVLAPTETRLNMCKAQFLFNWLNCWSMLGLNRAQNVATVKFGFFPFSQRFLTIDLRGMQPRKHVAATLESTCQAIQLETQYQRRDTDCYYRI